MDRKLMLCDCVGSMSLDADRIAAATGMACSRIHHGLCMKDAPALAEALQAGPVTVACAQEAALFDDIAAEIGAEPPQTVDIRDRAAWSDAGAAATPKIAALVAAAARPAPPAPAKDVTSVGRCLILGEPEVVLPVAEQLCDILSVTCLVPEAPEMMSMRRRAFDLHLGRVRSVKGAFGDFKVTVDGLRQGQPGGRGLPDFGAPRDGGTSACDIILDLSGGSALVPKPEAREGYLRADPGSTGAVARVVFEAAQMVGTFEKPLYVSLTESLCAHSRAGQTGCTRCLDICPTGAITSVGDMVAIDADICAGCGGCAAVCPSGAVTYEHPPVGHVFALLDTMARAFRDAGGAAPCLLVHDAEHGAEMISLAARFGRGLPAQVVPLEVSALPGFGHAEMLAALGVGFARVDILLSPKTERDAPLREVALANALSPAAQVRLMEPADPDVLSDMLYDADVPTPVASPILPLGGRREVARNAAAALGVNTDAPLPLPEGAPYGAVLVNQDTCTLCHACASLCPSGALSDNPDRPELLFREDACLQCGLCATLCPETAITLVPQMDLSSAALTERVMKEEEPYPCIECGKLFGVKSTIERIVAKLEGNHHMFTGSDNVRLIRMCDDCRIQAQYHSDAAPFQAAPRPRVRTTQDYLDERSDDES